MSRHRRRLLRLFLRQHPPHGTAALTQVYPEVIPKAVSTSYVPKVYGFKVYGRKGSKYQTAEEKKEITYYTQEELKKIKSRNDPKDRRERER